MLKIPQLSWLKKCLIQVNSQLLLVGRDVQVTFAENPRKKNNSLYKPKHAWSYSYLKGTVKRALTSLHGGSLEVTLITFFN